MKVVVNLPIARVTKAFKNEDGSTWKLFNDGSAKHLMVTMLKGNLRSVDCNVRYEPNMKPTTLKEFFEATGLTRNMIPLWGFKLVEDERSTTHFQLGRYYYVEAEDHLTIIDDVDKTVKSYPKARANGSSRPHAAVPFPAGTTFDVRF